MLIWVLITTAIVMGWSGIIGVSIDTIGEQCRERNEQLMIEGREGPPEDCKF